MFENVNKLVLALNWWKFSNCFIIVFIALTTIDYFFYLTVPFDFKVIGFLPGVATSGKGSTGTSA